MLEQKHSEKKALKMRIEALKNDIKSFYNKNKDHRKNQEKLD